jgi:hypothetical protein
VVRKVVIAAVVAVGLLALLVAALLVAVVNPALPRPSPHRLEPDEARLRRHVAALAAIQPARSIDHPESLAAAVELITTAFSDLGLAVAEQTWEHDGETYRNLVTSLGPADAPVLVVGAHYDVCGDQPGADDNASGVAALLELARLLVVHRPELPRRLELVAYCLEEPPTFRTPAMGSAVHARALAASGAAVEGMLSLEMVGYFSGEPRSQAYPVAALGLVYPRRGDFVAVVGDLSGRPFVRRVKGLMAGASPLPVWSINAPASIPGIDFSDHANYWREGFQAAMVTDTAFYRNPHYHQPTDTPNRLDYRCLGDVVRGLYAVVAER